MGKERSKIDHSMSQQACMMIKTVAAGKTRHRQSCGNASLQSIRPIARRSLRATILAPNVFAHEKVWIRLSVHLVNPSDNSFGTAVITPRWLFCACGQRLPEWRTNPILVDESLEQICAGDDSTRRHCGHQRPHRKCAARVRGGQDGAQPGCMGGYGGIHATLFPEEALERGEGHAW